jgi:hypothetical protein
MLSLSFRMHEEYTSAKLGEGRSRQAEDAILIPAFYVAVEFRVTMPENVQIPATKW